MHVESPSTAAGQEPAAAEPTTAAPANAQSTGQEQDSKPEMTREELEAELARVRKEAAANRIERKKATEKLEEIGKAKATDSERLAALEKELAESKARAARAQVAKETGLPEELILGQTHDEMVDAASSMKEHIDKLVAAAVAEKLGANPPMPVVRGEAAGGTPKSDEDWLRQAFQAR